MNRHSELAKRPDCNKNDNGKIDKAVNPVVLQNSARFKLAICCIKLKIVALSLINVSGVLEKIKGFWGSFASQ